MKKLLLVRTAKITMPADVTTCFGEHDHAMHTKRNNYVYVAICFYLNKNSASTNDDIKLTLEYRAYTEIKVPNNSERVVIETYLDEAVKIEAIEEHPYFIQVQITDGDLIYEAYQDIDPLDLADRIRFIQRIYKQPEIAVENIFAVLKVNIAGSLYRQYSIQHNNYSIEDLIDDIKRGAIN